MLRKKNINKKNDKNFIFVVANYLGAGGIPLVFSKDV